MATSRGALQSLRKQLEAIRESAGDDTSIGQALVLVDVALDEGVTVTELAERLDRSHSMTSRAVDILGDFQGRLKGRKPAELVARREIEGDRRIKGVYLTAKGRGLVQRLAALGAVVLMAAACASPTWHFRQVSGTTPFQQADAICQGRLAAAPRALDLGGMIDERGQRDVAFRGCMAEYGWMATHQAR